MLVVILQVLIGYWFGLGGAPDSSFFQKNEVPGRTRQGYDVKG